MRRAALPVIAAVMLVGCAAAPRVVPVHGAQVDPVQVTDWTARGRLAIAIGSEGGSGSFTWLQQAGTTDLQVRGPLGAGSMRIVTDGEAVTVTDADGLIVDTDAARRQIRARLGTDLPFAEMRFWLLGVAAPGSEARVRAPGAGPSLVIEQAGWTVSYDPFTTARGWSVPTRLTAASGAARIKVVLDEWRLPAPREVDPGTPAP